jgi:hypothetical protein
MEHLEAFTSKNGHTFYGLPAPTGTVKLSRTQWTVPEAYVAFDPFQHLLTSSNIFQHLPISSNIFQHLPTSSNIFQHLPTPSNIFQHLPTPSSSYSYWRTDDA